MDVIKAVVLWTKGQNQDENSSCLHGPTEVKYLLNAICDKGAMDDDWFIDKSQVGMENISRLGHRSLKIFYLHY